MTDGEDENCEAIVNFYGDGRLIDSITVHGGTLPKNFAVNVSSVVQLKIEKVEYGEVALGNAEF